MTHPYAKSPHHATAWRRGCAARLAGEPKEACPYRYVFVKPAKGRPIFSPGSNGYYTAWRLGWESGALVGEVVNG